MNISEELKVATFRSAYHKALVNVIFTGSQLSSHFDETLKNHFVTDIHYNILRILRGQYPSALGPTLIRQRMIRRAHQIPMQFFIALARKGWIKGIKVMQHGIQQEYVITKEGLELLDKIDPVTKEVEAKSMKNLTPVEAEQLSKLLDKLRG